jgi:dTDP-4-dehydrorhamnose reductase
VKALIFGQTGQVATELQRHCPPGWTAKALGREAADLADPAACAALIAATDADAVINAAAYTAVDRAEEEEALATLINGAAPTAMARAAAARGLPLLHISTDYVFDGSGQTPWAPDAPTAPLGAYGRSKLAGEEGVRAAAGAHAILRTSWVFSAHGGNFVKTMLRLGRERGSLNIVADQIGGPTAAADIAAALWRMADALVRGQDKSGIYHFAGQPDVSWADFAREIFAQAGINCTVNDIPSSAYPTPARRPSNSRLDCRTLDQAFGIAPPDWRFSLSEVLAKLGAAQHAPRSVPSTS